MAAIGSFKQVLLLLSETQVDGLLCSTLSFIKGLTLVCGACPCRRYHAAAVSVAAISGVHARELAPAAGGCERRGAHGCAA